MAVLCYNFLSAYILELSVRLSSDYMEATYNSCKEVAYPSTGGLVLDAACGEYTSTYCTAERYVVFKL